MNVSEAVKKSIADTAFENEVNTRVWAVDSAQARLDALKATKTPEPGVKYYNLSGDVTYFGFTKSQVDNHQENLRRIADHEIAIEMALEGASMLPIETLNRNGYVPTSAREEFDAAVSEYRLSVG